MDTADLHVPSETLTAGGPPFRRLSRRQDIVACITGGLLAGSIQFLVGAGFHVLIPILAPGIAAEYRGNDVFRPWENGTARWMMAHPFVYGLAFAAVLQRLQRLAPFFSGAAAGLQYGVVVFLIGSLPVYVLMYASLKLPASVVCSWILQSLTQYAASGAAVGAWSGTSTQISHNGSDDLERLTEPPWPHCIESGRAARKNDEATRVVEE